jgi:hypothetical protein
MSISQIGETATSATIPTYSGNWMALSALSNYAEYTSLFDQYWIRELECWITPQTSQSTTMVNVGEYTTAVDYDDGNTPTTIAMVQDKQNSCTTGCNVPRYLHFRPHVAVAEYGGTFTSFGNFPSGWIDSASPSVQHYGYKMAATPTTAIISFDVQWRALVSFRAPGI